MAHRYPERVERLIIFGGNAFLVQEDVDAFEATRNVEENWSPRMKAALLPVYGDDLQSMWSSACDAWKAILEERGGNICVDEARRLHLPTLVAHGTRDPICLQSHADWFKANIPGCEDLRLFEGGSHNFHLKFADEFNAMVIEFLTRPAGSS